MSIKYNNKTIAGYYKTEIIPNADTVNAGKIRIATQAEVDSGESNSTAVTPSYLSKKQDKLTAGKSITIENGVISADTTTGINVDGETISNENAVLSSIGTKTKSNTIKIDWEGTEAEYEAGLADGTISNDWYCYITDDETVVDFADHTELEVQNMYKTGNVSTDTTGYNQLVEMKSSGNKTGIDTVKIGGETVEIPYTLSKTGSKIVDVAYRNKVQALYNQEGKADYYTIDETNQNFTLPMGEIYGMKANSDLSNLTTTGEKHFLNKSQITNCLLEVPQRIKYTLENGTLTIKAGSVVIVPYGTKDKTADLPKGATFINKNFKVYDTQFNDGKFFVWTELVNDILDTEVAADSRLRLCEINITNNRLEHKAKTDSGASEASFTGIYYQINDNRIANYTAGVITDEYLSLPVVQVLSNGSYISGSISQVFNGMGYIGSTFWLDKGVKGLIPDGRNEDGSLKNIEQTVDKLVTFSFTTQTMNALCSYELADGVQVTNTSLTAFNTIVCYETTSQPTSSMYKWFDKTRNVQYYHNSTQTAFAGLYRIKNLNFARATVSQGKIRSLQPNFPARVATEDDIDGMWNKTSQHIINSSTSLTAGASGSYRDYDISSYLPNDGCTYEVLIEILGTAGAATNLWAHYWVSDAVTSGQTCSCGARSYSTVGALFYGNGILPMHSRTLRLYWSSSAGAAPIISVLRLAGYRKVR